MREIDWRVNAIVTRQNLERRFNASLHDKEIKAPRPAKVKRLEVSDEKALAMEQARKMAKTRIKARHGR